MLEARAFLSVADHASLSLRAHGPSAADDKARPDQGVEERLPARAGRAQFALALGLLKGIVDSYRKGWMRLLGKPVHGLRHALEEEGLGPLLTAVAVGCGNQFLSLGHGKRGEEVGKYWP